MNHVVTAAPASATARGRASRPAKGREAQEERALSGA